MRPVPVPGAISTLVAALIEGPERRGTVLAAFPAAVYVRVGADVLAVTGPPAAALPISVSLAAAPAGAAAGDAAVVGGGTIRAGGLHVRSVRRFDPAAHPPATTRGALAAAVAALPARGGGLGDTGDAAVRAALAGDAAAARRLLGRGPGLTPSGDDLLAGALAALAALPPALGTPLPAARAVLAGWVREGARARTTPLSAALLRAAAAGGASAPVAGLLHALCGGGDLASAAGRLVDVGATSGADLLTGVRAGAEAVLAAAA